MLSINLVHNISDFRYVEHPEKNKVTNAWLSNGEYEIEALGVRYPAKLHLKSPFDSKNLRIQGEYDIDELRYINGQQLYINCLMISNENYELIFCLKYAKTKMYFNYSRVNVGGSTPHGHASVASGNMAAAAFPPSSFPRS